MRTTAKRLMYVVGFVLAFVIGFSATSQAAVSTVSAVTTQPVLESVTKSVKPVDNTNNQKGKQAQPAKLYDVGPGDCVPGDQMVKDHPKASVDQLAGLWTQWVTDNQSEPCVQSMAASVNTTSDKFAAWLAKNAVLKRLTKPLTVKNTYFDKHGKIVDWKVQTFPVGELIWFDKKTGEPLFKFVCGNDLDVVLAPKPAPQKVVFGPKIIAIHKIVIVHHPKTPPTTPVCDKKDHPKPGPGYTWDQANCRWNPPTQTCIKTPKPGPGWTWDEQNCKWTPPTTPVCDKKDHPKPGPGYTWDQANCRWNPPTQTCIKTPKPGPGWTWDEQNCKWTPPTTPVCDKKDHPKPGPGYTWDQANCRWFKLPQSDDCMLNGGPNCPPNSLPQPPSNNDTSGSHTGTTPGASTPPPPAPPAPADNSGNDDGSDATQPPPSSDTGSDSGSNDGSGSPSGAHTGDGNTTTTPPTDNTVGNADGGNNGVSNDGSSSTGDGQIDNPFGNG